MTKFTPKEKMAAKLKYNWAFGDIYEEACKRVIEINYPLSCQEMIMKIKEEMIKLLREKNG